jgi:hypothetical protein
MLAEAYHTAIQATKNCDFDSRAIMRTCQVMLKQLDLKTTMPWLTKPKRDIDPDTLKPIPPLYDATTWNVKIANLSTLDKRWNKCLLGWVHGKIALCGTFNETNLITFDRGMFFKWMYSDNGRLFTHEEHTNTLVNNMYVEMQKALDIAEVQKTKVDFSEVLVHAAKIRKIEPAEREAAAVMIGHSVATGKSSDWLFSLVAPLSMANSVYGGKQINNIDGIIRNIAQKELLAEEEEKREQESLNDFSPSLSTQAENPSI